MVPVRPAARAVAACLGGLALLAIQPAFAQSVESDVAEGSEDLVKDASHYALPDVPDRDLQELQVEDRADRFSAKFGLVLLPADYTTFRQDAASKAQVGNQKDEFEARSLRLMMRGHFELFRQWNYMLSYEYKGFDQSSTADWNASDIKFWTDVGKLGTLSFGKMKEPYAYELAGDSANLPQHERLLSPFYLSRNVGVQLSNSYLDQRGTWAVGWFNDGWLHDISFGDSGNDFAGRVTFLPAMSEDGANYLHLGVAVRYYGAVNDELRYRGRPASNVADYYVDTGKVAGDHAWNTGLEALWSQGAYSVLAEYMRSDASTRDGSNPTLDGYYVTGSWVITGEHRPYDKKAGYARRILPQGRWGAVELIGRYGHVDLQDGSVHGGAMDGWWAGVNWWATRRMKMSIGYGDIDLDRSGLQGNTKTLLSRFQWIY
jgi:phosphate-selective porin OprO and OprP